MAETYGEQPKGILQLLQGQQRFQLSRYAPSPDLNSFVLRYWVVRWDLRGQPPYLQENIPYPCVNLVIERGKSSIYGVAPAKSAHLLEDKGIVFGVKFKPGGFYPFLKLPIIQLTNSSIRLREVFGERSEGLEHALLCQETPDAMIAVMEAFLRQRLPQCDANVTLVNHIVDRISAHREITRVDDIAERMHMNKRTLQRLFRQYVGVSPKWVIRHYRLHEAAALLEQGKMTSLSTLALDLGYFDQAHFIKDFKAMVGSTPMAYARINGG